MKTLTEQLVDIAMSIESKDPIDWGMLSVKEEDAYALMAANVLDAYLADEPESRDMLLLATVVKLTVENFVLNLHLMTARSNNT